MTDRPQQAESYTASQADLAEKILLEVWGCLGNFHRFLVLVGGLVPRYIIPQTGGRASPIPSFK